jgi:tripartite-type tricarboxylate transporter receptor subunit TctC
MLNRFIGRGSQMAALIRFFTPLIFLVAATSGALAQYPDRPITVTVGFAPGGTSDVAARILSERLAKSLGVAVVVENKPGAGGSIAAAATAAATPDGYRIMLSDPGAFAINPIMQPQNAKYDPVSDFTGIALVGQSPLILVVPAGKPFTTLAELVAYLRASTGKATYASSGPAGITQFGAEVFLRQAGDLSAVHVPYRGGAPMMEALSKGEADFGVAVLASAVPLISSGAVRPLALAAPSATPLVAKVPLLEQLDIKAATMTSWVIMIGPKGVPTEIVNRLNGAINAAIAEPEVKERLLKAGIETYAPATPAETAAYLKQDVERYRSFQSQLGDRLTK